MPDVSGPRAGVGPRSATEAEWEASTLVLAPGESGIAWDTGIERFGNGEDLWVDLPLAGGVTVTRKLLGPLSMAYDAAGFEQSWEDFDAPGADTGVTLPAGTIIETAWIELDGELTFLGTNGAVALAVVDAADVNTFQWVTTYDLTAAGQHGPGAVWVGPIQSGAQAVTEVPLRLLVTCKVYLGLYTSANANMTAGAVKAFLLYSEPPPA